MSLLERNAKIYGAVETETYITFEGFCKKIYDTEQQKVDIFIDDKKIDTIVANQKIPKIEDTYEVFDTEGFCFTYKLPKEYIGEKHKLEFKNIHGEQLVHSPIITMDINDPKYNENSFLESLKEEINIDEIRYIYCPNSIGFLAIKENLEDEVFIQYLRELINLFPNTIFNGFAFNTDDYNLSLSIFPKINLITPTNIKNILENIEIFLATNQNYLLYNKLIEKIGHFNDLTHRIYFDKDWYSSNKTILDLNNGEDTYNFFLENYNYLGSEINEANGNKAKLFFNKILRNAKQPLDLLKENDKIRDWYYLKRVDFIFKEPLVKKFLNKIFK
jgi:hypothetical protein